MGNETTFETEALEILQNTASAELLNAVNGFVHNKYLLDKAVQEDDGYCFADELGGKGDGPQGGTSFYRLVFPFAPVSSDGNRFSALVPTSQTLGCSWKWRRCDLTPEKRESYLTFFTDPARASLTGYAEERADFMWIRPLALVLPCEGKNRVDFLREENIGLIPARVSEYDYPAPSRMTLYQVKVYGRQECWAVLDGRWVERVNHPSWASPVLNAYGVPINEKWPPEFPEVNEVIEGFNHPSGNPDFWNKEIVDLERITSKRIRQQEVLTCSLFELRTIRLRSKSLVWCWIVTLFASLILLACLPHTWLVRGASLLGFMFGTAFGVGLLYFCQPFQTTRATLEEDWPIVQE